MIESDIDILISLREPRPKPFGYLALVDIEEKLSRELGRKVDLVTESGLNPEIRPYIQEDMVVIYEEEG